MSQQIIHAYRDLLRHSLLAIRHAKPARFTLVNHLRCSFRNNPTSAFDNQRISNTLVFLQNAANYTGNEQKIVRNLLHVWGCRHRDIPTQLKREKRDMKFRNDAYDTFDRDVAMLERTLNIRLT